MQGISSDALAVSTPAPLSRCPMSSAALTRNELRTPENADLSSIVPIPKTCFSLPGNGSDPLCTMCTVQYRSISLIIRQLIACRRLDGTRFSSEWRSGRGVPSHGARKLAHSCLHMEIPVHARRLPWPASSPNHTPVCAGRSSPARPLSSSCDGSAGWLGRMSELNFGCCVGAPVHTRHSECLFCMHLAVPCLDRMPLERGCTPRQYLIRAEDNFIIGPRAIKCYRTDRAPR